MEDESGSVLKSTKGIPQDSLWKMIAKLGTDKKLEYLKDVNPWGYTVFNTLQAPGVIRDLIKIRYEMNGPGEVSAVDDVIALAKAVAKEPHYYLRFCGD